MTFYNIVSNKDISLLSAAYALAFASTMILIVVAIAFFTVLERKVLAAVQRRRGPNMAGLWGLAQAFADGLKLLSKEPVFVSGANYYIFLFSPIVLLSLSLTLWIFIPLPGAVFNASHNYSFLVVFLFSGLNSYSIILAGLASNSRYSLLGGIRSIAQVVSYEIPLSISMLTFACVESCFNLYNFAHSSAVFYLITIPSLIVFFISILAETNRTPFDLPEAEAELVAGYNLEYSSILFSLFFLAEYSNMLVASSILSLMLFNNHFYVSVIFFCLIFILIRSILPRYTFRQLIALAWKVLMPVSVASLAFTVTVLQFLRGSSLRLGFRSSEIASINLLSSSLPPFSNSCAKELHGALFTDHAFAKNFAGNHFPSLHSQQALKSYASDVFACAGHSNHFSTSYWASRTAEDHAAFISSGQLLRSPSLNSFYDHFIKSSGFLNAASISMTTLGVVFLVSFLFSLLLVLINWIIAKSLSNSRKSSPYECGFEPVGSPVSDFEPNFTAVAIAFLIYDVEILLTYPWAIGMWQHGAFAVIIFDYFIVLFLLGYAYEAIDGTFDI